MALQVSYSSSRRGTTLPAALAGTRRKLPAVGGFALGLGAGWSMPAPVLKSVFLGGLAAVALCLAPTVHADDSKLPPGAPIIRTSDRSTAMAGPSEVRIAKIGEVQGGIASAGAAVVLSNGNMAPQACNPSKFQDPTLPSCR
ncbi:MAG TPA: hypothetical protein VET27_25035 [Mycobacterium sp.]|nr:hypothetical protein [Mycobacterium sp.]